MTDAVDKRMPQFPRVQAALRVGASDDERAAGYKLLAESYATVCAQLYQELVRGHDHYDELKGRLFAVAANAKEARDEAKASRDESTATRRELKQLRKELLGEAKKVAADIAEKVAEESGSHDVEEIAKRVRLASHHDLEAHMAQVAEKVTTTVVEKRELAVLTEEEKHRAALRRQVAGGVLIAIIVAVVMFVVGRLTK